MRANTSKSLSPLQKAPTSFRPRISCWRRTLSATAEAERLPAANDDPVGSISEPPRIKSKALLECHRNGSRSCDKFFVLACNEWRPLSKFKRATPVANWKMSSRRFCSMIKRAAIVLAAVTLSFGLALAPKAFADDMKKDSMSKEDSMKKDSMSKDSMSKDAMSKDSMSKDGMKKDEMKK